MAIPGFVPPTPKSIAPGHAPSVRIRERTVRYILVRFGVGFTAVIGRRNEVAERADRVDIPISSI